MSSVGPNDSVSSAPQKKSKPGKAERAARRAASSVSGVPASASKAAAFAAGGSSDPVPSPGKYPIVFQTGAGEPSRDREFAFDPFPLKESASQFYLRYKQNPRYAEFRAHAGIDDLTFSRQIAAVFFLGVAQQTVHSHVNMGLPQLDFSAVASGELRLPSAVLAVIGQYGEFSDANLGTRFVLGSYSDQVRRLVWTADRLWNAGTPGQIQAVLDRSWLPASATDRNFKLLIAERLRAFIAAFDLDVPGTALEDAVISGTVPDFWEVMKEVFGNPPAEGQVDTRDRFDFVFRSYADVGQFSTAFTTPPAQAALAELGLVWGTPQAGHLDWEFNVKQRFSDLADKWARFSAAYAQFFELGSSLATRSNAQGSPAQFVKVDSLDVVTVVRTMVALSAPQFSLASCFPPGGVFSNTVVRNVVVSTPLSVSQRTTEWLQLDWR